MIQKISRKIIEENLKRVENGEPLSLPLSQLDGVFKLAYIKQYGADIPLFSSPHCKEINEHRRGQVNEQKKCPICEKEFWTDIPQKVFCSKECRDKYYKTNRLLKFAKEELKRELPENKIRAKETMRLWREKRRVEREKLGLCSHCGKKKNNNKYKMCLYCRKEKRKDGKIY